MRSPPGGDGSGRETCGGCRHFARDPLALERALPGIAVLSSAHATSRAEDGLCRRHNRLLRASASCALFAPAVSGPLLSPASAEPQVWDRDE